MKGERQLGWGGASITQRNAYILLRIKYPQNPGHQICACKAASPLTPKPVSASPQLHTSNAPESPSPKARSVCRLPQTPWRCGGGGVSEVLPQSYLWGSGPYRAFPGKIQANPFNPSPEKIGDRSVSFSFLFATPNTVN